jgi:hypothetical protein
MKKHSLNDSGIQLRLKKYKKVFRVQENLDYYPEKDYRTAEKKLSNLKKKSRVNDPALFYRKKFKNNLMLSLLPLPT